MKKIISIALISLFIIAYFVPVFASLDTAPLHLKHYTDYYLQFSNGNKVRTAVVVYNYNNKEYPAYCIEPSKPGVGELPDYEVKVKDAMNDDGIWRIVTNGYPYKTPSQMGLNNSDEAYFATKQAIYRYLAHENEEYYGGGGIGTAGKRVYDAIARLLDIGYHGTEKIINATANITQEKELNFDNINTEYYSTTYSVSSNTTFQNYVVEIETDKNGILITDENNNIKSKFKNGQNFKVLVPRNIATTNFNVEINTYLSCESKPILYGEAYNNDNQDYIITTDPYEDVFASKTLSVKKLQENGELSINKIDSETQKGIEGVTFELYKNNIMIAKATSNSQGIVTFSHLDEGRYIVKETSTNKNYILNTNSKTVTIPFNGKEEIIIKNEHKRGNLKIYKLDKDNQKITLGGIVFNLFSHELNKVVGTYTTNENGEIYVENLRTGKYSIRETITNEWYELANDVDVQINYNETTEVAVFNELKKGQVKIIKTDMDNNQIGIEGVKFNVINSKGQILETIITDENGKALTDRYPIRDKYIYLQEIETNNNYLLNSEIIPVELQKDKVVSKNIENESKKGKIQIIKRDADNKELPVSGTVFNIICEQTGKIVDTITTDNDGLATSKDLSVIYTYSLVEIETNEKYILNDETITNITVTYNETKQIEVVNELKKGQVMVKKIDKDNNEILLEGVVFDVIDEQGNIVDTLTTNEKGKAISKLLPCIDIKYILREKSTKTEYVLSEERKEIMLEENQIKDIIFENEKIKGNLQITKVDAKDNSKTLAGAKFGIYNEDKHLIQEVVTNEHGIATSDLLVYGKYYFQEIDTGSKYYLLNTNTYEFEIQTNGENVERTIANEPVNIQVNVEKEGTIETEPNKIVNYSFTNIENTSNIYLDSFKWFDYIPTEYIRLETMTTGTFNQDLMYSVYYKTNKSDEYILYKENLDTKENYNLDFTQLQLNEDEYIVETFFDFGKVDIGFRENISPTMQCKTLNTVKDTDSFINNTKTVGIYEDLMTEANSTWITVVHIPKIPEPVLPKTGK